MKRIKSVILCFALSNNSKTVEAFQRPERVLPVFKERDQHQTNHPSKDIDRRLISDGEESFAIDTSHGP